VENRRADARAVSRKGDSADESVQLFQRERTEFGDRMPLKEHRECAGIESSSPASRTGIDFHVPSQTADVVLVINPLQLSENGEFLTICFFCPAREKPPTETGGKRLPRLRQVNPIESRETFDIAASAVGVQYLTVLRSRQKTLFTKD
jgi:hypothetical protein